MLPTTITNDTAIGFPSSFCEMSVKIELILD